MRTAPRLSDGTIIPSDAVYRLNRFSPSPATYAVHAPWLPESARHFDSREAAVAAIVKHWREAGVS